MNNCAGIALRNYLFSNTEHRSKVALGLFKGRLEATPQLRPQGPVVFPNYS